MLILLGLPQWLHVYSLYRFLSTESEQLIWKSEGLPSDELSMENAMVILQVGKPVCMSDYLSVITGCQVYVAESMRTVALYTFYLYCILLYY